MEPEHVIRHLRVHVDDAMDVIMLLVYKPSVIPPSRSVSLSKADCTLTGCTLRNSCHSVEPHRCPSQRPVDSEFSPSAAVSQGKQCSQAYFISLAWCGRYRHWLTAACEHVRSHMGKNWLSHVGKWQNYYCFRGSVKINTLQDSCLFCHIKDLCKNSKPPVLRQTILMFLTEEANVNSFLINLQ